MPHPQSNTQIDKDFDATMQGLKSSLAQAIGRDLDADRATPAPRPVVPAAPPAPASWGPSSPRVTSPLSLLIEVAGNSYKLQEQVAGLYAQLTGSPPAIRTREAHKLPNALLPAISALAHEIGSLQSQIATTLNQLKEELL